VRIHSMTATFGKLEHQTLTLKPGLNIIEAPNEWGKSTWCAFLTAMLYGLDTRAKTTKTALADKERYAPWSGLPMEGRMELCWQGREITIERRTKGRIPMGDFRAYETDSGLPVSELTARNCGELLLGVERSVFVRSAMIRFSDLLVNGDEALRQRLHALVTTGDESAAGEQLARQLKELKNRCRYNRTGLLPQAEGERAALDDRIYELDRLEAASQTLRVRLTRNGEAISQLENHAAALAYQAAQADARQVRRAEQEWQKAEERIRELREKEPERKRTESVFGKPLLLVLPVILTGILLGAFWNMTAGILAAVLGLLGLWWLLAKKGRNTAPTEDYQSLLAEAQKNAQWCRAHFESLRAMARPMPRLARSELDLNAEETDRQLRELRAEQGNLQNRLSQYAGRMEALGDRAQLEQKREALTRRIEKLEQTYAALTLAQETLAEATMELQRRFAPRIAKGAARRMEVLTGGRYRKLQLGEDFSLLAGAAGEATLREALWRSDGTVDQLYLALRMSVAEALIPDAPLILDDALVRFDDTRLKAALTLLREEAENRQVILFTCQSREKNML